jgi:pimeloyl-ACP methyl ester carboxylesterase
MKRIRITFYFTLACLLLATFTQAQIEEAKSILPQMPCEALMAQDFSTLPDAATQILWAEEITGEGSSYCQVTGYIAPQIQFEIRLPMTSWTGRYMQLGCGGFCGFEGIDQKVQYEGHLGPCVPENLSDYVVGGSNGGHVGGDAQWTQGSPQLRIDWAYRSEHALNTFVTALITTFYEREPDYRYFAGCSNGGRQALMLAQRYPEDFDGILVGAAGKAYSGLVMQWAWSALVNKDVSGNSILTPEVLPILYEAALASCDSEDGLEDGLIDDPRACTFDPKVVECTDANQQGCLTSAQVETAHKLYGGPVDATGQHLSPGGMPIGSEMEWSLMLFGWNPPVSPGLSEFGATEFLEHLATWDETLSLEGFQFNEAMFKKLATLSSLYDVTDPDLSAFHDAGGKLILWHGWEDAAVPPQSSITYYRAVQSTMGEEVTQDLARLYLLPGFGHCGGGSAGAKVDVFGALVDWVEQDTAPQELIATLGEEATRTRPLYPYPTVARYDGSGNPDNASSFTPSTPSEIEPVSWLGDYRSGNQQWCRMAGNELQCQAMPFQESE